MFASSGDAIGQTCVAVLVGGLWLGLVVAGLQICSGLHGDVGLDRALALLGPLAFLSYMLCAFAGDVAFRLANRRRQPDEPLRSAWWFPWAAVIDREDHMSLTSGPSVVGLGASLAWGSWMPWFVLVYWEPEPRWAMLVPLSAAGFLLALPLASALRRRWEFRFSDSGATVEALKGGRARHEFGISADMQLLCGFDPDAGMQLAFVRKTGRPRKISLLAGGPLHPPGFPFTPMAQRILALRIAERCGVRMVAGVGEAGDRPDG
jgi:hypothetical protein